MSEKSPDDIGLTVYRGAGEGMFAGLLAALLTHWVWGLNLLIMAFVYGFSMASLRGWRELAGILTMIGTTVASGAIYDVIVMDSIGHGTTIGLVVLVLVFLGIYAFTVATLVDGARVRTLHDFDAMTHDVERSQHWEEKYFAPLRSARVTDRYPISLFIQPIAWSALGIVVAALSKTRLVDSLAWGVVFFHALIIGRMAQYLRRVHQPSAAMVIAQAERRPILFLRPFALDALPVSPIGEEWYAPFHPLAWLDKRTFEEHLTTIFQDLGPVIAIGRPGEEVSPLGAARVYADEASWQALVLDCATRSEFVIIEVDAAPGVVWEISEVSRLIGLQRILVILPPGEDMYEERSAEWYERWAVLQREFSFLPDVFKETAAVLYDDDDQPILVAGDKSSVPKSLNAVKGTWLKARRR